MIYSVVFIICLGFSVKFWYDLFALTTKDAVIKEKTFTFFFTKPHNMIFSGKMWNFCINPVKLSFQLTFIISILSKLITNIFSTS